MQCPDGHRDFITYRQGPPGVRWILRGWSHQVKRQSRGSSEGGWQQRDSGGGPEPEGAGNPCSQCPSSQVLRTQACTLPWFMKRQCDFQLTQLCPESRGRAVRQPSPHPACVQGRATWVPTPAKAGPPGVPPPTCVQGGATWVPTHHLCPRRGHMASLPPVLWERR